MNTLTIVALILGILASIYAVLAGIEQRTGSRVLHWVVVPLVRLMSWLGAPREDIKKLQAEIKILESTQAHIIDLLKDLTSTAVRDSDRVSTLEKSLSEFQSEQQKNR